MSVPPLLAASRLPRPALAPLCSVPAPSLLLPQRNTLPETARNGGPARPRVRPGPRAPAATPPLPEAAKPRRARCQRLGSAPSGSRSRERSCGRGPSAPPSAAFAGLRLVRIGRIEEISVCPEPVRLSLFLLEASVLLPPPRPPLCPPAPFRTHVRQGPLDRALRSPPSGPPAADGPGPAAGGGAARTAAPGPDPRFVPPAGARQLLAVVRRSAYYLRTSACSSVCMRVCT